VVPVSDDSLDPTKSSSTAAAHGGTPGEVRLSESLAHVDHDQFYANLVHRSVWLVSDAERDALRRAVVLVAGCGGAGAGAAIALARHGVETFVLVDNGVVAPTDIGHEPFDTEDIGWSKVDATARHLRKINPFISVAVFADAIGARLADEVLEDASVAIDGVGLNASDGVAGMLALHRAARARGVAVVSGFSVAGSQWTQVYDYRDRSTRLLDGLVNEDEAGDLDPVDVLARLLQRNTVPIELSPALKARLTGQTSEVPRLHYSAAMFAALVPHIVMELCMERPLRSAVTVDVPTLVRPRREQFRAAKRSRSLSRSVRSLVRDLRGRGRLGVYSPLDDVWFDAIRDSAEERLWEQGSVIVRQGDPGDDFFVILEGEIQVELEDESGEREPEIIARLGPGEYFGELALLAGKPRNASIVAATRCVVLRVERESFETFLEESAMGRRRVAEAARSRTRADDVAR
jgi:CRP-like cAMP-binding protein/predicted ThiF/HesA family dinucleotide-utilizing enzyme